MEIRTLEKVNILFMDCSRLSFFSIVSLFLALSGSSDAIARVAPRATGSSELPTDLSEPMDVTVKTAQEWNQLIPQKFREIVQPKDPLDFGKNENFDSQVLNEKLASLEFDFLNQHVVALEQGIDPISVSHSSQLFVAAIPHPSSIEDTVQLSQAAAEPSVALSNSSVMLGSQVESALRGPELPAEQKEVAAVSFVEAFDWATSVDDTNTQMISLETIGEKEGLARGWRFSSAPIHWPTLNWSDPSRNPVEFVPLLSNNTIKMLASLQGVDVSAKSGIVFGRVMKGWSINYSGAGSAPIYLDLNLQPIQTNDAITLDRYFVILNAEPGAQLLYLDGPGGVDGSVSFPVLGGTSTYVDLTQISVSSFSGYVVSAADSEDENAEGIPGATVRVVGQSSGATLTRSNGYFVLNDIVTVGTYPFHVETDSTGYTHRYVVQPQKMTDVVLYRLPSRVVRKWIRSLFKEKGVQVQADTGIVVSALPQLVSEKEDLGLIPSVSSIPSLAIPQTYILSPADELETVHDPKKKADEPDDGTFLQYHETRFIGVQVPAGPTLSQVNDETGRLIWAEMVVASPGVINMVGPY